MLRNVIVTLCFLVFSSTMALAQSAGATSSAEVYRVTPTSMAIISDQTSILIDPVGPQSQYSQFGRPDIVVLTRADPEFLSIQTMIGMLRRDTVVLAPQAVIDELPLMISNNVITPFEIGGTQQVDGISFTALEMDEANPSVAQTVERRRGDMGVLIEVDGRRLLF
ncbi:MAG: hypothetical protein AAGG56_17595 [Pseudomonadota bacterium]